METATTDRGTPSLPRTRAPSGPRWSVVELLPVALLATLGTLLLLPGHALWFDELFTAEVGRLPLGDILSAITSGQGTTSCTSCARCQNGTAIHHHARTAATAAAVIHAWVRPKRTSVTSSTAEVIATASTTRPA